MGVNQREPVRLSDWPLAGDRYRLDITDIDPDVGGPRQLGRATDVTVERIVYGLAFCVDDDGTEITTTVARLQQSTRLPPKENQ